jgi:hypothetical protein
VSYQRNHPGRAVLACRIVETTSSPGGGCQYEMHRRLDGESSCGADTFGFETFPYQGRNVTQSRALGQRWHLMRAAVNDVGFLHTSVGLHARGTGVAPLE